MRFATAVAALVLMLVGVVSAQTKTTALTVPNSAIQGPADYGNTIPNWTINSPVDWTGTYSPDSNPPYSTYLSTSGGGTYSSYYAQAISQTLPGQCVAGDTYTFTVGVWNYQGPITTGNVPAIGNSLTLALSTGGTGTIPASDWINPYAPAWASWLPVPDANGNFVIVSGGTPIVNKTVQDMDPASAGFVDYTVTGTATASGDLLMVISYSGDGEIFVTNARVTQTAPLIPGDINGDGLVDVADYNIWAANVGATGATWAQGDLNGDGLVDVADYNIWAANVGRTSATPEPISMIVLAIGGGLVALRKNRA
jgi:hypothetical protein